MAKHPEITVQLSDQDGNAFVMVSRTRQALRKGGVSEHDREVFYQEALSGDYDHVLQTIMKWVTVE